jgi:hypothetical protein
MNMDHKCYHNYLIVNLLLQGRSVIMNNQTTRETDLHIKAKQKEETFFLWPCDISGHPLFLSAFICGCRMKVGVCLPKSNAKILHPLHTWATCHFPPAPTPVQIPGQRGAPATPWMPLLQRGRTQNGDKVEAFSHWILQTSFFLLYNLLMNCWSQEIKHLSR